MTGYIHKRDAVVLAVLLVVCLCLGSVFDYQISCVLFDPANLYGRVIEALGELPFELCASAAGVMLVRAGDRGRAAGWVQTVLGVAVNVAVAAYEVHGALRLGSRVAVLACAVSFAVIVLGNIVIFRATRGAAPAELRRWAVMVLAVWAIQAVILNLVVKPLWSRPRMRVIAVTPGLEFQPWWRIGHPGKAGFIAAGVAKDGFKSFASGHTAHAAIGLMLAGLPAAGLKREPSHRRMVFWVAVAVTAAVALGRIIAGAHFVSDVTCGFALTFAAECLVARIACPRGVQ